MYFVGGSGDLPREDAGVGDQCRVVIRQLTRGDFQRFAFGAGVIEILDLCV